MKILHLEASSGWGGQEIRILSECIGMRARGHEMVLAVEKGSVLARRARDKGFVVYEVSFRRKHWPVVLFQLFRIMKRHQIEIVNTHSSLDAWIGGIAARLMGKKIVRTRHLSTAVKGGWNSRFVYGSLADHVMTTCQSIISHLSCQSKRPASDFSSIPTGVNLNQILADPIQAEKFRQSLGIKSGQFLVGTVCFMRSWKGLDDFLLAANQLRDDPALRWVIIGGGHEAIYRKKARELNLEGIVFFTGHLECPYSSILALDAFALLSTANEGVSQAILQAAYLGRPLIATETGGLCEVCIPGQTGIVVPIRSPSKVAEAVLCLKNDPTLCEKYGMEGKKLVFEQFRFEQTLDKVENLYRCI